MQFLPYLSFDGNCREAMTTYQRIFGGKFQATVTYGEAPGADQIPAAARDRIMHTTLDCDGGLLMASDTVPGQGAPIGNPSIAISYTDVARAREVANALAEGGSVPMPMQETFWVEAFGVVIDRFGISWLINAGKERMAPRP